MLRVVFCTLLLGAGIAPAFASSRTVLAPYAAAAPAPGSACIANPFAPIDDPPAFPTAYLGGCKRCSEDGSACEECHIFFGLTSDGHCVECPRNGPEQYQCLDCVGDEPTRCLSCVGNLEEQTVPGLYASADGECLQCGEGCVECSNLNGTCARCASGYGLMEDRKCVRCAAALGEDVENCDGDPGRATSCAWGYSVDARSGTCFKCEVEGCQDCSAPGVCRTCRSGYGFGKGGACVECMIAGCTECAEDAEKTCTDCNGGAYALPMPSYGGASVLLANGSTSALSADAAICEPCADPFCSACDVSYMCSYCREDSGRGVELCTGACVPCFDENCTLCPQNAAFCWSCRDGWRMNPSTGGCTACGAVSSCATCETDAGTGGEACTGCKPGFELRYSERLGAFECVAPASP